MLTRRGQKMECCTISCTVYLKVEYTFPYFILKVEYTFPYFILKVKYTFPYFILKVEYTLSILHIESRIHVSILHIEKSNTCCPYFILEVQAELRNPSYLTLKYKALWWIFPGLVHTVPRVPNLCRLALHLLTSPAPVG